MKKLTRILILVVVLSLVLTACVTQETPEPEETEAAATEEPMDETEEPMDETEEPMDETEEPMEETEEPMEEPATVVIGSLYPLTGPVAATGVASQEAILLAVDIINNEYPDLNLPLAAEAGLPNLGGAKIEVVFADHQMDPETGASETERLITEEEVVAVLGAYASSVTETSSQAAERLGIPFVNAQSTSPRLHTRGFQYYFRTTPHDAVFSELMFEFLADVQEQQGIEINSVATIYENTLFGSDSSTTQQGFAEQYGYDVVGDVAYPKDTADMTSEVLTLRSAEPDVVLPTSYISDAILMVRTFKDQNYCPNAILAQGVGFTEGSFLETVGSDGDYILSREVFSLDLAEVKPLVSQVDELFAEQYDRHLEGATARSFTAMLVLADAINRAGSTDPDAIAQALRDTDIPADQIIMPWQGVRFDENGQNELGTGVIVQAFDGQYHTVWPFDLATQELVWPFPCWDDR